MAKLPLDIVSIRAKWHREPGHVIRAPAATVPHSYVDICTFRFPLRTVAATLQLSAKYRPCHNFAYKVFVRLARKKLLQTFFVSIIGRVFVLRSHLISFQSQKIKSTVITPHAQE